MVYRLIYHGRLICEPKRELGSGIVGMDLATFVRVAIASLKALRQGAKMIKAPQFLAQAQKKKKTQNRHLAKKLAVGSATTRKNVCKS